MDGIPCDYFQRLHSELRNVTVYVTAPDVTCAAGVIEWGWETSNSGWPETTSTRCNQAKLSNDDMVQLLGANRNRSNPMVDSNPPISSQESFRNCFDVEIVDGKGTMPSGAHGTQSSSAASSNVVAVLVFVCVIAFVCIAGGVAVRWISKRNAKLAETEQPAVELRAQRHSPIAGQNRAPRKKYGDSLQSQRYRA